MASFTDQIVEFNPYITQIPVDDYVRVGMQKQLEYDRGVKEVQGYIDNVAGLEVIKPEQKTYLQQRVGQLQSEVSQIISKDFSNQQLVDSVGSLSSRIASDPIIQNAAASTRNYKAGLSAIAAAREKGKSGPANEWYFQDQFQKWYSDKDVNSKFSSEFTQFTDVNKKIVDIIKELEPNSQLEDIPYKRGANGQILITKDGLPEIDYAMMEKSTKGLSPERIQMAIRASLDQNDIKQLQLDGMYTYRGADKEGMKKMTESSYSYRLNQINDTIKGLLVNRQTNTGDSEYTARVDAQIEALKDKAENYQQRYKQDVGNLDRDVDGYKSSLYMDNWLSRFGEGYSYSQNSLTYKENPYFMAAERRRENDIKFEEFKVNMQFKAAELALSEQRLNLDRERTEAYKFSLQTKKGKPGEDPALPLTGDAIFGPIDQENLERINEAAFMNSTQNMSDAIDTQRMALLAQIRPDLVSVVRDPSGLTRRYEYIVDGKDPNSVKSEAEATLLKIKDSYDKGQEVEDGAKVYFDNLANTSQRVENRKAAVNKLTADADKTWNLQPLLAKVKPLVMSSGSGATYTLSPQQQVDFNKKVSSALKTYPSAGVGAPGSAYYDQKILNQVLTSPAEKFLYSVINKKNRNDAENQIAEQITNVQRLVNQPAKTIIESRDKYVNNAVREITGVSQPVTFPVEAFKNEDRGRAQAVVVNMFNDINSAGKANPNPNYDRKNVSKMLEKANIDNTSFSLVAKGNDDYALRLSNTDITNEPREIDITKSQAQSLFGANKFLDDFQSIREALQLTRGTGRVTTDVSGQGRSSAFSLKNGLVNNYGVKYHVEEPLKDGGLQVRLYIYDKSEEQWKEKIANFGQLLNEAQVTKFLSQMSDQYVDALLKKP